MIIGHKEISTVLEITSQAAKRRLTLIKKAYKKSRIHKITIDEFCSFEILDKSYVLSKITKQ